MIEVGILTKEQKELLVGQWFASDSYFNAVQDINDNWFISVQQINQCVNEEFMWVKDLELIPYNPKEILDL
jgi:ribosomal protein L16 Arg81 hydroxylase